MSSVSEFADFIDALCARRQRIAQSARSMSPADAEPAETRLLAFALADLADAEAELRAQNDALFDARVSLEESAANFRDLFDLAPVAYVVTDGRARIQQVNAAACAMLGRPANSLVGKPLTTHVPPGERRAFREALTRSAAARDVEEWPLSIVPTRGTPIECRVRVRVLRGPTGAARDRLAWVLAETPSDAFDGI